ncbi:MAG: hypothetical protein V4487_06290 [Chlamydiota bacterium]
MKKTQLLAVLISQIVIFGVYAGSEPESQAEESQGSQDKESVVDRVIEAIAEAAISNPGYGKDISDR